MTVRRLKTYTAATGYVYQYYFVGRQPAAGAESVCGFEYVFAVSSDRKTSFAVTVLLDPETLAAWAAQHGRELSGAEQFAAVKMRLFQAFDEVADLRCEGHQLRVEPASMAAALNALGIE